MSMYRPGQSMDISKVLFVFRRLGFSVKFKGLKLFGSNPNHLIDELFDQALNMPFRQILGGPILIMQTFQVQEKMGAFS